MHRIQNVPPLTRPLDHNNFPPELVSTPPPRDLPAPPIFSNTRIYLSSRTTKSPHLNRVVICLLRAEFTSTRYQPTSYPWLLNHNHTTSSSPAPPPPPPIIERSLHHNWKTAIRANNYPSDFNFHVRDASTKLFLKANKPSTSKEILIQRTSHPIPAQRATVSVTYPLYSTLQRHLFILCLLLSCLLDFLYNLLLHIAFKDARL